jgi:diacylglycerol kinase (ATP)
VTLAILPAGTANLLATNLGLPDDLEACVRIGLDGARRGLDVGKVNGEHFGVMAGAGLDAMMIRAADAGLKDRVGRIAYVWTGAKNVQLDPVEMSIDVDAERWFEGEASCVLVGNVGDVLGGLSVFRDAVPDDGYLDLGVVTADGAWEWARTLGRGVVGDVSASPFVTTTTGRSFEVRLVSPMPYQLDGGDRKATRKLKVKVKPSAITVCVPEGESI